ncbi:MAG: hypothetical protein A3G32_03495 [Deltaproteobacteria bacterium RIFCSPLOWO2_12_FULL_40_28]|nr:MAG: hypothetical protein A3C45_02180 [Deltaproteobacteria bacterium RIFCSPHIGHO2_02_FULL_40_28]OGQ20158.1 MAG: hypothetical protein A3E27_01475 [Deltaproteobacteria bacterium RIFCSPHIGHO2_12_FULL_40_32]OGQ40729.1 MAG: hypothetical protein A3I69_02740 [Deltaproteobacteria bacterium RIFCSPLOWO2_02_FULL_40_36]OGQ54425.1 MAG: hypothetical protein A3G32_03495 [Deltaproteobacteria bacterium RIFCSPLOWO2_12_FULL_40_28]
MKFSKATIIKQVPQTPELTHIEVECDASILKSFTTPGQYVGISSSNDRTRFLKYYAMSNPPGEKHFSFLIKNTGEAAKNILDPWYRSQGKPLTQNSVASRILNQQGSSPKPTSVGDKKNPLLISEALGNGFATSQTSDQNILLVGVGSCFGVFRSLILHFFSTLKKPQITFLYGAKTAEDIPYQKDIETWEVGAGSKPAQRMQFLPSLSRPNKNWNGLIGHVQTHFDSVLINAQTSAYLCGMKEMIEDCQKKLAQKGVSPHSIFLNY